MEKLTRSTTLRNKRTRNVEEDKENVIAQRIRPSSSAVEINENASQHQPTFPNSIHLFRSPLSTITNGFQSNTGPKTFVFGGFGGNFSTPHSGRNPGFGPINKIIPMIDLTNNDAENVRSPRPCPSNNPTHALQSASRQRIQQISESPNISLRSPLSTITDAVQSHGKARMSVLHSNTRNTNSSSGNKNQQRYVSMDNIASGVGSSRNASINRCSEKGSTSRIDENDSMNVNQDTTSMQNGPNIVDEETSDDDGEELEIDGALRAVYWDIGDASYNCEHCGALFWYDERIRKYTNARNPKFSMCCRHGQIQLPLMQHPPELLRNLLYGSDDRSKHFRQNIRCYNTMFSFTSMRAIVDKSINKGKTPPIFRINGQNYHQIGSLLPSSGSEPKFAQLYIYDTDNEVQNRINAVSPNNDSKKIHREIVEALKAMLDDNNVLVKSFRMVKEKISQDGCSNVKLRLIGKRDKDGRMYNLPSVSEVAALIVEDFENEPRNRDIVVETQSGQLKRINELHPSYLGLQYPLLFPYGQDGFRECTLLKDADDSESGGRKNMSMREFFAFRLQERGRESPNILFSRRLFQQFLVDAYTMIETSRLTYIRTHQKELRCDMFSGLSDALCRGDTDPSKQGRRVILPSSFTGGARYMINNYQDAMAICKWVGYPDLFITFTCNPKWPEIQRHLVEKGLKPEDRPDIICRVFKMKLDHLMKDLKTNKVFGKVKAAMYTIEFQKRGLPHAHILLFLSQEDKYPTPDDIDRIISAEIPDEKSDPAYYTAVKDLMMHGPCGNAMKTSPCMANGKCTKNFPKRFTECTTIGEDGYPVYMRKDDGRTVKRNGVELDNTFVVPHNRELLMRYGAHINVEWCNQSRSIKYLFKYVNKGHDRVTAVFYQSADDGGEKIIDEISMYYDCRYISACEAAWRLFAYDIHYREPSVERLAVHLPNEQSVFFTDSDNIEDVMDRPTVKQSMFLAWFEANKTYEDAKQLTYAELPTKFVWDKKAKKWRPRKRNNKIGRVQHVAPGSGELYYLRILVNVVRGPMCFEDLRTVDGSLFRSFRDACYSHGLLEDDREYVDGIVEASHWDTGHSLRRLFATLLSSNCLARPEFVWERCWEILSEDLLQRQRKIMNHPGLRLMDDELKNYALVEIEKILRRSGSSLREFDTIPFPDAAFFAMESNKLIQDELNYDKKLMAEEHAMLVSKLNEEQKNAYNTVIHAVESNEGGVFFLYGYGGTGKTFVWKTLSAALRSKGDIVLNVASSGIASLLLPGGRTTHSRFAIPLNLTEESTCNIKQGSPLAELIVRCKLIIWDEAPMMHKYCFEALDKSMKDILRFANPLSTERPFGGKSIVFGGDFRQILPVIPKGSRQDIVLSSINSSYIWKFCKVLRLTKNMRLQNVGSKFECAKLKEFSDWISSIGDGTIGGPNDGTTTIEIPDDLLIKTSDDSVASIVESIYPRFMDDSNDGANLQGRAILAPTLEMVEVINDYIVSRIQGETKEYYSSDSICKSDCNNTFFQDLHSQDFLNSIRCSGVPNHELKLKLGIPVMLLRNIDHSAGLCNGTRLIITRLGKHVVEAKIISSDNSGHKVFIPRMTLTPSDPRLPFKFQRRQFPLIVSYAMTINKSQGQSLSNVGIYLKRPVFSHGQLYVAISRVTNRGGLKILICDKDGTPENKTTNVVFKEVFQNLE